MRAFGFVLACCTSAACATAAPDGAPGGAGGKGDQSSSLRDRLHAQIADHVALSYHDARDAMFGITDDFDLHAGLLECIYTGRTVVPDGTHAPDGFNTEHVWPQSQGAGDEPPRSDLHHLFTVDAEANTNRASHPFGDAACGQAPCAWSRGGSTLDLGPGGTSPRFEVRAERRGDVARAKFYFAVRYELAIPADEERTLRTWHAQDPPDARESARTDAIFALQRNRNPFVDEPTLVDAIDDF